MDKKTDLAIELNELRQAAEITIPLMATSYAQSTIALGRSDSWDEAPFKRGKDPAIQSLAATPELGPVYPKWVALRDGIQNLLADTEERLESIAAALSIAVKEYAATDKDTGSEVEKLRKAGNKALPDPPKSVPDPVRPS